MPSPPLRIVLPGGPYERQSPPRILRLALHRFRAGADDSEAAARGPQVKRSGKTFVDVYLQEDFKGRAIRLEVPCELNNDARLKEAGIPNDSIMCLKIPDGVSVTLYAAAGYGGASQTFTGKVPTLGRPQGPGGQFVPHNHLALY